jgi:hypothetical protein
MERGIKIPMQRWNLNKTLTGFLVGVVILLSSCTGATSEFVSSLFDGNKWEELEEKALQYMIDSFGDHFELSSRGHHTSGSAESTERHIYVVDTEHPYDDIDVINPGYDDGKGEVFVTNYANYLFGNDAGPEWAKLMESELSEGAFLPRIWKWNDNEEDGGTTRGQPLMGLTQDSTLQEFMETAPIEGVLLMPVDANENGAYTDAEKYATAEKTWAELDAVDDRYDISIHVILLKREKYDELAALGAPLEEFAKEYYSSGAEKLQLRPRRAFDLLGHESKTGIFAVINYIREDGEMNADAMEWEGIEESDYDAE